MRVDFYIYSGSKRKASAKPFYTCRNWPIASPEKGWKITFALKSKDPSDNEQLKTGEVMHVAQTEERYSEVWVDMEEFTKSLQDGLSEAIGWRRAIPATLPD